MRKNIVRLYIILIICLLYACSIKTAVNPVNDRSIDSICIEQNDAVFSKEFGKGLKNLLENKGISAEVYRGAKPNSCIYRMSYTAEWGWDMASYLKYAKLYVYENEELIGDAEYDARRGSERLDKFGRTAAKIKPLLDQLFPANEKLK